MPHSPLACLADVVAAGDAVASALHATSEAPHADA